MAALGLVAALLLAACSSEPDVEPIEPADTAADAGSDDAPDDDAEEDEAVPEIFQGQLYPPLPDLEPDERGGDVEIQREVLASYAELYELVEAGLATNDLELERLEPLADEDFIVAIEAELSNQREAGEVTISPDGASGFVRVMVFEDDEAALVHCLELGPESGAYDDRSGEPVDLIGEERTLVRSVNYGFAESWRATSFQVERLDAGCEEFPGA